jgi:hypothetical protein
MLVVARDVLNELLLHTLARTTHQPSVQAHLGRPPGHCANPSGQSSRQMPIITKCLDQALSLSADVATRHG